MAMGTTDSPVLHIRTARTARAEQAQDAAMAAALEAICFPPEQAASPTTIAERMAHYADHFWLIEDEGGTLLALVNGLCTNEPNLSDEMYESPTMHDPDGAWQMIFGVATAPAAQGQGLATRLLRRCRPGRADVQGRGAGGVHTRILTSRSPDVEQTPVAPRPPMPRPGIFSCGRGHPTRAGTGLLSPTASNVPARNGRCPRRAECPRP